jgi:dipeptidase
MCDTFVSPPQLNAQGHMILGKNSDREPEEVQVIVRYPAGKRAASRQRCTFKEVDHPADVFEVMLSKPFQMWGAEMGVNEKGVAIGNEAVFTKWPFAKKNTGLTGMDMLRLALEVSPTAQAALEYIIDLNERYGQDACGGYKDKGMFYHNSFLIADTQEAFVLETAGPFWAVEKVKGYRAISNGLSIGKEYDRVHPGAADVARQKGWLKKGEELDFAKAFSAFWMPRLARCTSRRALSEKQVREGFSVQDAFKVLRSHAEEPFEPSTGTTGSVCMHASGLFCPHQTTGSMVAELRSSRQHTVWLTGSPAPCLSVFKPFYFGDDILHETNPGSREAYWKRWDQWHRTAIQDYTAAHQKIQAEQSRLENAWIQADVAGKGGPLLSRAALDASAQVLESLLYQQWQRKAPWLYKRFWKR